MMGEYANMIICCCEFLEYCYDINSVA